LYICDDVLSDEEIDEIESTLTHPTFNWFYQNSTNLIKYNTNIPFMCHLYIRDGRVNSNKSNLAIQLLDKFCDSTDFKYEKVLRAQTNLLFKQSQETISPPHVDDLAKHHVLIYYVNDTDGDTLIYGEDRSTVIEKVTPKKGRFFLFDGSLYHSATAPITHQIRLVFNYNIVLQENNSRA
jgi:hypothetical protein